MLPPYSHVTLTSNIDTLTITAPTDQNWRILWLEIDGQRVNLEDTYMPPGASIDLKIIGPLTPGSTICLGAMESVAHRELATKAIFVRTTPIMLSAACHRCNYKIYEVADKPNSEYARGKQVSDSAWLCEVCKNF